MKGKANKSTHLNIGDWNFIENKKKKDLIGGIHL